MQEALDLRGWLKLELLSKGIRPSKAFIEWFSGTNDFVRRRNFYNSPNWGSDTSSPVPQEIRLPGEGRVTVAVNEYVGTEWELGWNPVEGVFIANTNSGFTHPAELIEDLPTLKYNADIARTANLYGGSALSFFSPRACYFFAEGSQCRFCSLAGTADEDDDYANRLHPDDVYRAVVAAVESDRSFLNQVMIVGGNERNLDRGFMNQTKLVQAASKALQETGAISDVSVHLIAMPPRDLSLLEALRDVPNLHAGFNLEVWDPVRFVEIAPGKTKDYGQNEILHALGRLVDIVGPYRAHSILIAGLERPETTLAGARALAEMKVSPIINAYHSDRHSTLGLSIRPDVTSLEKVASGLHELHQQFPIEPYWKGCGRNALDYEASIGLFSGPTGIGGSD